MTQPSGRAPVCANCGKTPNEMLWKGDGFHCLRDCTASAPPRSEAPETTR